MCEATTIAIVASGAASAASGYMQGQAAKRAAESNAAILESDAKMADVAAGDAIQRGAYAEGKARIEGGKLGGAQKTQLASSGIDTQSGSALDVLSDTSMMTELDAQIVKNNAARESWGYETQAESMRRKAALARQQASDAGTASILGGITGGASVALPFLKVK